jgi:hypothetical protein
MQLLEVLRLHGVAQASGLDPDQLSANSHLPRRPTDVARNAVVSERGRLQRDKYTFTAKEREKAAKSTPPIDLQRVTAQVDAVMRDPNIADKDKKKSLEDIRNRHGIPGNTMHELFTGRLGRVTKESAQRLEKTTNDLKKSVGDQLRQAEKAFGKNSPEALAIRSQLEGVDRATKPELQRLNAEAGKLDGVFKPRGRRRIGSRIRAAFKRIGRKIKNGFKKIGRGFKKLGRWVKNAAKKVGRFFKKTASAASSTSPEATGRAGSSGSSA